MDKKNKKRKSAADYAAPGIDPDDSYGEPATRSEIENGESTMVTRLVYDEHEPSKE